MSGVWRGGRNCGWGWKEVTNLQGLKSKENLVRWRGGVGTFCLEAGGGQLRRPVSGEDGELDVAV